MSVHFLWSLFYLGLTILLVFCYFLVPFCIYILIRWLRQAWKKHKEGQIPCLTTKADFKISTLVFVAILVFTTLFYVRQRSEWMGDDNAHLTAKEYWVSGQVLDLYRSILTRFTHPDNRILYPMNILQEHIYNVGIQYLPKEDGEIGIWLDGWLVYPYSKRFRVPKGINSYWNKHQTPPMFEKLLERSWLALESLATKPIADRQMYEEQYLRNFAGMAHYQAYHEAGYTASRSGSSFTLSKIPKFVHRSELLVTWLEDLRKRWDQSEKMQKFLKQNPEVAVMRYVTLFMELDDILLARINADKFSCSDPYWTILQNGRKEFPQTLRQMRNREKARKFEYVALNSPGSMFVWYVFDRYCGIQLAGEVNWEREEGFAAAGGLTLSEYLDQRFHSIFTEEIEKLEEQKNGSR